MEYEIVKGDQTYEVQIDFDKNSHKATKIDVAANMWRADATKRAMQGSTRPSDKGSNETRSGGSKPNL